MLEGAILVDTIRKNVQNYLRRYNREYDLFKVLSVETPIVGTELRRMGTPDRKGLDIQSIALRCTTAAIAPLTFLK
ncbi:MAG: hypothetical protein E5X33_04515 [Mesorhizobium sp.]|uniref:hypothetical protein n=1 Tax=unclassified Mesorhizobium TaxID=325217 RepID=UPI000FE7B674|nr:MULTISPECIES: hypothetical protein [unclassified Mesorhizobium]MDG4908695.1 hypothetical protein [Mesorhizobium sp. WSM4898]RWI98915.1 MAG: hypothetical protein EOR22_02395 [Mesorhizobium sp.]TIR23357.1 MAG: hypothetical protein E5X33_04515 [Mesorhizobium sp.]